MMNDDEFRELVEAEQLGEAEPDKVMFLHDAENLHRWRDTVVAMLEDVNSQLSLRKADLETKRKECLEGGSERKGEFFDYKEEYDQWRGKAVYRKKCVEQKLRSIKRFRAERAAEIMKSDGKERWNLLEWASDLISADGVGEGAAWHRRFSELKERKL